MSANTPPQPPHAAPELVPLFHALHPPLPLWKFTLKRLRRRAYSGLMSARGELGIGDVIFSDDVSDADARGFVPPPPATVAVWLFHPDAHVLARFARSISDDSEGPVRSDGDADIESFNSFCSKRFCDAAKHFRRVVVRSRGRKCNCLAVRRALTGALLRTAVRQGWAVVGTTIFKISSSSSSSNGGGGNSNRLHPIPCCSISVLASMDSITISCVPFNRCSSSHVARHVTSRHVTSRHVTLAISILGTIHLCFC